MAERLPTAAAFLPPKHDLKSLRTAAAHCKGCPLFQNATQTVFGEGPSAARVIMIGEQPGDREDKQGKPFVGSAGRMMDKLIEEVGLPRKKVYVTNAVKHFKWTPRGTRRMHAKPSSREIFACRPWLEAELEAIRPLVMVLLGPTAAQSLLGSKFRLTKERGRFFETDWSQYTLATYHPSALLRATNQPGGEEIYDAFREDLRLVAEKLAELK
jgi:uracil-DNA glycosylase